MTLAELLEELDSLTDDLTIYAAKAPAWSAAAPATACLEFGDAEAPGEAHGMSYLLEVPLAKEAVQVWSEWRGGREPTVEDKCEAVIYYAENDTYLPR